MKSSIAFGLLLSLCTASLSAQQFAISSPSPVGSNNSDTYFYEITASPFRPQGVSLIGLEPITLHAGGVPSEVEVFFRIGGVQSHSTNIAAWVPLYGGPVDNSVVPIPRLGIPPGTTVGLAVVVEGFVHRSMGQWSATGGPSNAAQVVGGASLIGRFGGAPGNHSMSLRFLFSSSVGATRSVVNREEILGQFTSQSTPTTMPFGASETQNAASSSSGVPFRHWKVNGIPWTTLETHLHLPVAFDMTLTTVYSPAPEVAIYGSSCAGLELEVENLGMSFLSEEPLLGKRLRLGVGSLPGPTLAGSLLVGFFPAATALDGLGAPGCELLTSSEVAITPDSTGTFAHSYFLEIPNDPQLVGGQVFLQALTATPGVNALGIALSNGVRMTISTN